MSIRSLLARKIPYIQFKRDRVHEIPSGDNGLELCPFDNILHMDNKITGRCRHIASGTSLLAMKFCRIRKRSGYRKHTCEPKRQPSHNQKFHTHITPK